MIKKIFSFCWQCEETISFWERSVSKLKKKSKILLLLITNNMLNLTYILQISYSKFAGSSTRLN